MLKRIVAIVAIFVCTAVAWAILGSSIFYRTYNAESGLAGRVASTWGAPQGQAPPAIAYEWPEEKAVEVEEKGKKITRRSEEHTSELQSLRHLVCRLLLEKKKQKTKKKTISTVNE